MEKKVNKTKKVAPKKTKKVEEIKPIVTPKILEEGESITFGTINKEVEPQIIKYDDPSIFDEVIEEEVFLEEEKSIIDEIIEDNKNEELVDYYNQIKENNEAEENDKRLLESIKEFMMYLNSPRGGTPTVENMLKLEQYHNLWFGLNYKILCCSNLQCKVYDKMMRLVGLK